ncbi:MAG: mannosyltransferase family protein [Chloroflexota bacterium]
MRPTHFPWRAPLLFAIWWIALQGFALLAFNRFELTTPDQAYTWTSQIRGMLPLAWRGFADLHVRFDSGFYLWIARDGYTAQTAAFLPLYPLLIKLSAATGCFGLLIGGCDGTSAAFIVSNLSAFGAAIAIALLAALDLDEERASTALFYFLIFPTAFFLTTVYTEPLFICLAATSLYAARRQQWGVAGVVGALAMLTRVTGLALFAALVVEWFMQRRPLDRRWLWLLLIPLTFLVFELFLEAQGFSFFASEQAIFKRAPLNLDALAENLDVKHLLAHEAAQVNFLLDVGLALFVFVISGISLVAVRPSYGVYGILCILLPFTSGHTLGLDRFALAAFTVPLTLARFSRNVWLDRAYTLCAILLLALYTLLFVQGYWAG